MPGGSLPLVRVSVTAPVPVRAAMVPRKPVELSRLRPAGSAPADNENVKGVVPPVAEIDWLYAMISLPFASDNVVMLGAGLMVRLALATLLSLLLPSSCR